MLGRGFVIGELLESAIVENREAIPERAVMIQVLPIEMLLLVDGSSPFAR